MKLAEWKEVLLSERCEHVVRLDDLLEDEIELQCSHRSGHPGPHLYQGKAVEADNADEEAVHFSLVWHSQDSMVEQQSKRERKEEKKLRRRVWKLINFWREHGKSIGWSEGAVYDQCATELEDLLNTRVADALAQTEESE